MHSPEVVIELVDDAVGRTTGSRAIDGKIVAGCAERLAPNYEVARADEAIAVVITWEALYHR